MSVFFFFKQKTAYELRISDWSSDVCSSDLRHRPGAGARLSGRLHQAGAAAWRTARKRKRGGSEGRVVRMRGRAGRGPIRSGLWFGVGNKVAKAARAHGHMGGRIDDLEYEIGRAHI